MILVENGFPSDCFLVGADVVREFNGDAEGIVHKVIFQNERACETMKNAAPVFDWLAVTVDGFGLKNLNPAKNLLGIGDAGAFIDPLLVGFKAHLSSAEIEGGRCEIYFFRGGYGGLNRVENGFSNHCFLVGADVVREFNGDAE